MNLNHGHYVPVLKLKPAEKAALCGLKPKIREAVVPLFEVVERVAEDETSIEEHIDKAFKKLGESICCYAKYFLDAHEIEAEGQGAIENVFRRASTLGHPFIPVTFLKRGDAAAVELEHSNHGVAIRLSRDELVSDKITNVLSRFMNRHKLSPDAVDLVVDLGQVESMVPVGVANLARKCLSTVPATSDWRSLILSGCDFPKSMGVIKTDSHNVVDRSQWVAWSELARTTVLDRTPTFSDCGIQHSTGVEGVNLKKMKTAPSIRYALDDRWLLIKGRAADLPSDQYSELAANLTVGDLRDHFAGHNHCIGCDRMRRAAEHEPEANSRMDWRRFGTIHHITRTLEQVASNGIRIAAHLAPLASSNPSRKNGTRAPDTSMGRAQPRWHNRPRINDNTSSARVESPNLVTLLCPKPGIGAAMSAPVAFESLRWSEGGDCRQLRSEGSHI